MAVTVFLMPYFKFELTEEFWNLNNRVYPDNLEVSKLVFLISHDFEFIYFRIYSCVRNGLVVLVRLYMEGKTFHRQVGEVEQLKCQFWRKIWFLDFKLAQINN